METITNNNQNTTESHELSKDEVDFIVVAHNNNNSINYDNSKLVDNNNLNSKSDNVPKSTIFKQNRQQSNTNVPNKAPTQRSTSPASIVNTKNKKKSIESTAEQKKSSTRERLSLFSFSKKNSHNKANDSANCKEAEAKAVVEKIVTGTAISKPCQPTPVPIGTPPRQHKFVKSSSIARLLGNTYNAKKFEKEEQKRLVRDTKFHTYGGRRRSNGPYLERFKQRATKEDGDVVATVSGAGGGGGGITLTTDSRDLFGGSRSELVSLEHFQTDRSEDLSAKAFRTISRGLGKLWWKRTHSVEISTPDPEFKVSYLGNVLTGWAKGEGCVEKQLNTLWRNYTQNSKPDVIMRIKVCASGLKATTRQHGLTEYWANRITHCCAPKNYPRVFCWIYRHEGRKLKHELRCHAVLCSKEKIVQDICNTLKENVERALLEFKREKILKQNARLSLANAAYDNPSLPRRKILLSVGGNNYRPPLERSKSAPKLMSIEEAIGEEDGDEIEETNEPEMKSCCQKDSLYPAMTLGRRRCRRGHSIRRTGKARPHFCDALEKHNEHIGGCCNAIAQVTKETAICQETEKISSYGSGSDSDDFEKLLKHNDYDSSVSLANELLPYFDMQLHKNTSLSLGSLSELKDDDEPLSLLPTINSDPSADPDAEFAAHDSNDMDEDEANVVVGLRRDGVCSDGEEDYDDMYFRQAAIINLLHRNSMRKMANLSLSSDESSIDTNASAPLQYRHQVQSSISSNASSTATSASAMAEAMQVEREQTLTAEQRKLQNPDSDEGSISSGCETASTVTANQDDISLKYRQQLHQLPSPVLDSAAHGIDEEDPPITAEEIYQRLESRLQGRHNSDATTFSSSSSITLKLGVSPTTSINGGLDGSVSTNTSSRSRRSRRQSAQRAEQRASNNSDSECSDESGYVEFQERDKSTKSASDSVQLSQKPLPPPKPMPRRLLGGAANSGTQTAV